MYLYMTIDQFHATAKVLWWLIEIAQHPIAIWRPYNVQKLSVYCTILYIYTATVHMYIHTLVTRYLYLIGDGSHED